MRLTEIDVPKGCKKIFVDFEDGRIVVSYASGLNEDEIFCEETGEIENLPRVGDFSILWNEKNRDRAVCVNCSMIKDGLFWGCNVEPYTHAIKFRNYDQYLRVRGAYGGEL